MVKTQDFDPARYLDFSGGTAPDVSDLKKEGDSSYGFGSRNCVGRHMANNSLFVMIAVLLWAMKFERKEDSSGQLLPLVRLGSKKAR
jgi:cytochrome P450